MYEIQFTNYDVVRFYPTKKPISFPIGLFKIVPRKSFLMMMSAWSVHMTVLELFFCGWTCIYYFTGEMQFFSGKRVIKIHADI
jgi:hypothetical protein